MALDAAYPTSSSVLSTMAQWEAFFRGMSASGIVPGVGSEFAPSLNSGGRTAVMGAGAAQIRGFHVNGPTTTATPIPAADTQNRLDRLVLRLDRAAADADGWITPAVITGTPSAAPQAPALTQTEDGLFDLPVARWTSASNGSLSGLVDERLIAAGPPLAFNSAARPPASIRRLGFEMDTGRVLVANGTDWSMIWEDTGWVALPLNWPNVWQSIGTNAVRKVGNMVELAIQVKRIASTYPASDPDGTQLVTVPAGLRPTHHFEYFPVQFAAGITARIQIGGDGVAILDHPDKDVAVGRELRATLTYLV